MKREQASHGKGLNVLIRSDRDQFTDIVRGLRKPSEI